MLAKLKTFSLLGIEALPVEVEVDVSPVGLAEDDPRRTARGGGQGEHASRRAGDRQLGLPAAGEPDRRSTWPRPNCPSRRRRSICRSRWAFWPAAGRSSRSCSASTPWSANWPWTARRGRPRVPCRWPSRRPEQNGLRGLLVPSASAAEAAVVERIEVIAVASLTQAVGFLTGQLDIEPTPVAARRAVRDALAVRRRFRRRPRPGDGQAGADGRGGRRAQRPDARAARLGQDDAGQAAADDPARPDAQRVDRDDADLQCRRPAQPGPAALGRPAVSLAAPHDQRRGPGRRRLDPVARRNQPRPQRRALPRRTARVQPPHARSAPPAAGGRHGDDLAGRYRARRFRPISC